MCAEEADVAGRKPSKHKQNKAKARQRAVRKKGAVARAGSAVSAQMGRAARWPLRECFVNEGWDDGHNLAQVLVARSVPGRVAFALFLVDLQCLGVKNCIVQPNASEREYADFLRARAHPEQQFVPCEPPLAAAIVRKGVDYAAELGFRPHPDYRLAAPLLEGLDPGEYLDEVPCGGSDGKPLYVAGPHDDVPRIMARLRRRLGDDGLHFVSPMGGSPSFARFAPDSPGPSEAGVLAAPSTPALVDPAEE
jgi:hypothetical protein